MMLKGAFLMKKLITILLCVLMLFTIAPLDIFALEFDEMNFSLFSNGENEKVKEETSISTQSTEFDTVISYSSTDEKASVTVISSDDERLSEKYLLMYAVDNSTFTCENNGGALNSYYFSNAFDRNWNTVWRSQSEQVNGFTNTVDVSFKETVTLDRILYQSDSGARGYPVTLKLQFASGKEEYTEELSITSTATGSAVIFDFGQEYEVTKIRLEWMDCPKNHRYEASAREIVFLQPESEETLAIDELFTDYNQFTLNEKYNSISAIEAMEETLKDNLNYEFYYKDIIERAKKVATGELSYNAKLEFATKSENTDVVEINQYGALRSYAQNTLRLSWFGTDRQITGLYGKTGEVIKVYVEASDDEKCLPSINITQHYGSSGSWKKDFSLKKGLNLITVPDFGASSHTSPLVAGGGPIYISNPYTAEEQGEVKIYIEGAYSFPVYRMLSESCSEKEKLAASKKFLAELEEFCKDDFVPGQYPFDLIELQSDHCIMTVKASLAKEAYITAADGNYLKVQNSLENYDAYMERLMAFEGISCDPDDEYYDERNEYLNINFRASQATGVLAYAAYERVGLLNDSWQNTVIYAEGKGRGWGLTHEIGHVLDMYSDRAKTELTNNMLSKYNETALDGGDGTRGFFNNDIVALSSDRNDYTESSYLSTNMYNYCIWWHLESYMPSYWAKLSNMYRYYHNECDKDELALINSLNKDEKQIYYSSLILGIDLGYYYERYGYKIFASQQFVEENASDAYKALMSNAVSKGRIDNTTKPRFWYLDEYQYNLVANCETGVSGLDKAFLESEKTYIKGIEKTSLGYSVIMPAITDNTALMGYEIYEGQSEETAQVIGFSKNGVFLDTYTYEEGYTPKYYVKAYNRDLSSSAISDPAQFADSKNVCAIGDIYYTSIKEAVENANENDTITLLCDITETGIVIDKNLTIKVIEGVNVTQYRGSNASLFAVNSNCTLNIIGEGRLTLDGNLISQSYPLINVAKSATLNIETVKFQNAVSTSNGGAILLANSIVNIKNCTFENNKAASGGAVAATVAAGRITVDNTIFKSNIATSNGAAIYTVATFEITNSTFQNNSAVNGGAICNSSGGVLRIKNKNTFSSNNATVGGALWLDGYTEIVNADFISNTAKQNGGAIYYSTSVQTRKVAVSSSAFEKNEAGGLGNDVYAMINSAAAVLTLSSNEIETSPCLRSSVYVAKGNVTLQEANLLSIGISDTKKVTVSASGQYVVVSSDNAVNLTFTANEVLPNLQIGENKRVLSSYLKADSDIALENVYGFSHTESDWIIDKAATCKAEGLKHKECIVCKVKLSSEMIATVEHSDTDGDGKCDSCFESLNNLSDCSCMCHKKGFSGFIWKILRIFYKLFGMKKVCACGVKHY